MSTLPHLVVVGTGYAGIIAALRAARRARGRVAVTLVGAADRFVERVRLHELGASGRAVEHPVADLLAGTPVRFVRASVRAIEPGALDTSAGRIDFDRAIVCTGGSVDQDAIPGAREFATPIDGDRVEALGRQARELAARRGRLVVCGGGLTGVEVAAEFAESLRGLQVELVTGGAVAPMLGERGSAHVRRVLERLGVRVRERTRISAVEAGRLVTDAGELPFDVCAWALGFRASPLISGSGLAVAADGRARVDAYLRAEGRPDVFVAGDAAAALGDDGRPLPAGCKTAMPLAAHAAETAVAALTGAPLAPFRFADVALCVSLGRRDGIIQGMDALGRPTDLRVTGRPAAWLKELVCRFTVFALKSERRGWPEYRWPRPKTPALSAMEVRT